MPRLARCRTVDWDWTSFLHDLRVMAMDATALGVWVRLLGALWESETPGEIVGDLRALQRVSGASDAEWSVAEPHVVGALERTASGWRHARTLRDHEKQTKRIETQKVRSDKGNMARWGNKDLRPSGIPEGCPKDAVGTPKAVPPFTPTLLTPESKSTHLPLADARSSSLNGTEVTNGNGVTEAPSPRAVAPLPAGWPEFWSAYPSKVGKAAAIKAYARAVRSVDHPTLMAGLSRALTSPRWTKDGGQYIPNPATWLNQGRWDDQIPAQQQTSEGW